MAFGNSGGEKKARGGALADINVTPLVDILLVLLIIFMVTAPTVFNATVQQPPDLQKPIEQPDPKNDQEEDIVKIDAKGTIKFRKNVLTQAQLYQLVKQDKKLQISKKIYINADLNLNYGQVMEVFGVVRRAGMKSVGIYVNADDLGLKPSPPPARP